MVVTVAVNDEGNGDGNEGLATKRVSAARQWRWGQGWWVSNGDSNEEGSGDGNEGGGRG
jgi:hypothetical protein